MKPTTKQKQVDELAKCLESPVYFIRKYCKIYDAVAQRWVAFDLWPEQEEVVDKLFNNLLVVILKARQLGLTWLGLSVILWFMLFAPIVSVLIFSRRDDEAVYLLGVERMRGMYKRLPPWMTHGRSFLADADHRWMLSNESVARAFPTTAGDSYTASIVMVDEADLIINLNRLMRSIKPTIDAGGRLWLISRADKTRPGSEFKNIYRASKAGLTDWVHVFLPWSVHPGRDAVWYAAQKADILGRTGSDDDLLEQYPSTDAEALSARKLDKRLPADWLLQCYDERKPLADLPESAPGVPGLVVYRLPRDGDSFVVGIDPAEGNPTSNDSAFVVLDRKTGEEVAKFRGKVQPAVISDYADQVGLWYNEAAVMVERNNHGHAVLLWFDTHSRLLLLLGHDDKPGWLSSARGRTLLFDYGADAFRCKESIVHSFDVFTQLGSVDGSTLKAPEGQLDDLADAYVLALAGIALNPAPAPPSEPDLLMLEESTWQ